MLELVVAIAVLAILLAILVPAVMSARESSRRVECTSHLRQFGHALHSFEAVHRRFPPQLPQTGVDPGSQRPISRSVFAPHVYLLPHLDQAPLFTSIDVTRRFTGGVQPDDVPSEWRVAVPVFLCPSDGGRVGANYRCCTGPWPDSYDSEERFAGTGAFSDWRGHPSSQFPDGLSQTVFMSERKQSDEDDSSFGQDDFWYAGVPPGVLPLDPGEMQQICGSLTGTPQNFFPFAGHSWVRAGYSHTWYNHVSPPNSRIPDCSTEPGGTWMDTSIGAITASSRHSGGVNVLHGDGSVRFVADGIDLNLWRAIATRNQHEVVD
jgi:prepilin-type processing-associated H-X9-DG protein